MIVDRTWGIDRAPHSPTFGRLVVGGTFTMPIMLWKRPGCQATADNLSGALRHNEAVIVSSKKRTNGALYCFVKAKQGGMGYWQQGWLRSSLLKDMGDAELNREHFTNAKGG